MTHRERRSIWALGACFILVLSLAAACGGDGEKEVTVSLSEWSITAAEAQTESGKVRFEATNDGTEPHELVIIRTDLSPTSLPVVDGKVDEERVEIVDEIEPFAAGSTESKTVELSAGRYVLICNIVERVPGQPVESHYEKGMRAAFLVTGD
jgi:hypothetical protein